MSQSCSTSIPIPQELILEIVDELARQDDYRTLGSFSLVQSAFLLPCRSRIYRSIRLGPRPEKGRSICGLLKVLQSSPHLAEFVQDLTVLDYAGLNQIHWLLTDTHLAKLLPLLPRLSTFALNFTGRMVVWSLLPPSLKYAVAEMLKKRNITSLELSGMHNFPGHLLYISPRLKNLALRTMYIPPPPSPALASMPRSLNGENVKRSRFPLSLLCKLPSSSSAPGKVRLDSLTLVGGDGAGWFVQECFDFDLSGLQSFTLGPRCPSEVDRAREIMLRASSTISSFTWIGSHNLVSPAPIELWKFPSLRTVNFHSALYWDDTTNEPPQYYLEECIQFLRSARGKAPGNQIESVSLTFDCTWWSELPAGILYFLCNDPGWACLAEVLSDKRCFPALRSVSMTALVHHSAGKLIGKQLGSVGLANRKVSRRERYDLSDIPRCLESQLGRLRMERKEVSLDAYMIVNDNNIVY